VVAWCLDLAGPSTGGADAAGNGGGDAGTGADGTGGDTTSGTTTAGGGGGPGMSPQPPPCGPWAMQRTATNPTDNYGTWNEDSEGAGSDGTSSYPLEITKGALEYSVFPCEGLTSQDCLRIDRLSVVFVDPDSMVEISLNLLDRTPLMPISSAGDVDVPIGALRFGAHYLWDGIGVLVHTSNAAIARARIDPVQGKVDLVDIVAHSDEGDLVANLSLHGDLINTQPRPKIAVTPGSAWNRVVLTAQTTDAESDPLTHRWMVLGEGTWGGDSVEVTLPEGRHAVVLYADDVHKARGITATWVEISRGGMP